MGVRRLEEEKVDLAVQRAAASLPAEIRKPLSSTAGMAFCTSVPLVKAGVLINLETFLYFAAHYEKNNPFRPVCEQLYKY